MKNSDSCPSSVLHRLENDLASAASLCGFDDAAADYVPAADAPASLAEFESEIIRFTRHLFQNGMTPSQCISDSEAYALSVDALESAYSQKSMGGYALAIIEVLEDGATEISTILQWLAESLKEQVLARHRSCVLDGFLNELDWNSRMQLAEEIQSRYEFGDVAVFSGLELHALANHLAALLQSHWAAEEMPGALTLSEMT